MKINVPRDVIRLIVMQQEHMGMPDSRLCEEAGLASNYLAVLKKDPRRGMNISSALALCQTLGLEVHIQLPSPKRQPPWQAWRENLINPHPGESND